MLAEGLSEGPKVASMRGGDCFLTPPRHSLNPLPVPR